MGIAADHDDTGVGGQGQPVPVRQFRTWLMAWLVSRPEASIRLIP
jgi:hypothetical protein